RRPGFAWPEVECVLEASRRLEQVRCPRSVDRSRYTGHGSSHRARVPATVPREMTREISTDSAEETIALGRTLADLLVPPNLVLLPGDLGAGKTTLVKRIAAAFQAASEEDVTSPTFTLIHEYRGPHANLFHIDLYRIDTQRELDTLALDDLRGDDSILLIEWGEKFPWFVRDRDIEISLERDGENRRKIHVAR